MADFFTILGAADASISLWEKSKGIWGKIAMIKKWLIEGRTTIAILGAGGTGKTTLAHYLTSDNQPNLVYNETVTDEKVPIGEHLIGEYWVAPGQKDRRERYWTQMFREISEGKICGVIHVVSYGFHSIDARIALERHILYQQGMTDEAFLQALLVKNRQTEVEILQEIKHRIKDSKKKIWMITLVLKQDLWWNEKETVEDFYTTGAYNQEIAEIQAHRGARDFEHIYLSASIVANNFVIGGKTLQPITQGYDENLRLSNLNELLKQLKGFLSL